MRAWAIPALTRSRRISLSNSALCREPHNAEFERSIIRERTKAGLAEARKAGREVHTATFPFQANGRALTLRSDEGFVRVTARADNHLVLGIAAVGTGVSELASAFTLALEMGARLEDIGGTIHVHPTLGEAFHEASLRALGEALHI